MDRWRDRVALVTGASSGVGACLVEKLLAAGMKVAGLARRADRLEELGARLAKSHGSGVLSLFRAIGCDLRQEGEILAAFKIVEEEMGPVAVLVNNAGVLYGESVIGGKASTFREILDVNVLAGAICAREASKSMRRHKVAGHIININSIAGHDAHRIKAHTSLYCASKYAVTGFTESLRNELFHVEPGIKVTSISPGSIRTDMIRNAFGIPENVLESAPFLEPAEVADAVVYVIGTPPNVQINEITLKHVKEP